jgi:predicted PurR-regulated permease PerM
MSQEKSSSRLFKGILVVAAIVIILAGIKLAASLIVLLLLASFAALICLPTLYWLRKKGVPDILAVSMIVAALVGGGMIMAAIVGTSLSNFTTEIPAYSANLELQMKALFGWLSGKGVDVGSYQAALNDTISPGSALGFAGEALVDAGGAVNSVFMLVLTVAFILFEVAGMPAKIAKVSPDPQKTIADFEKFISSLKSYLAIKTLVSFLTGLFIAIWLYIVGVDFPILWGTVAFALNYVPTIGSIIAAIPALLLTIVQLGPVSALWAGLGYVLVNFVMGNVVEPRITGRSVGLSTLVVFLSLLVWGWFLGPVGMLLSVPLTIMIKIALESHPDTRHIAVLLGSAVEEETVVKNLKEREE